jgi:filamentous hemagglutinin family protein
VLPGVASGLGGVSTDGTLGGNGYLGQPQVISGVGTDHQVITVPAAAGSLSGTNLFHSFGDFNIGRGQTVVFEDVQKNFVDNVIARVTGGSLSSIDGRLSVTPGGHANFYLLNPKGVIFGAGASIDVPGGFHVSTASFIKFQDGARFGTAPINSRLSSTDPSAFGFTNTAASNNALISVRPGADLKTAPNQSLDFVASRIELSGGSKLSVQSDARLSSGSIADLRLQTAGNGQTVSLVRDARGQLPLPANADRAGRITLGDEFGHARVAAEGSGTNHISLGGADIQLSHGSVVADIRPQSSPCCNESSAGGIDLVARTARLEGASTIFTSVGTAEGKGDSIDLQVGRLALTGGSTLSTEAPSTAAAGNIQVSATSNVQIKDQDSSIQSFSNLGDSGDILVYTPGSLSVMNGGSLYNVSQVGGLAGKINVQANQILLNGGSIMSGSAGSPTSFDSGSISLKSASLVRLQNATIQSGGPSTNGGLVSIVTDQYVMTDSKISLVSADSDTPPPLNLLGLKAIALSHSNINTISVDGPTGPMRFATQGNILLRDSSINSLQLLTGASPSIRNTPGDLSFLADTMVLDGGQIYLLSGNQFVGRINLDLHGLFPSGNRLNGLPYAFGEVQLPVNNTNYVQFPNVNFIGAFTIGGRDQNTVITGTLLNLSGSLVNLGIPEFWKQLVDEACLKIEKAALSSDGRGNITKGIGDALVYE